MGQLTQTSQRDIPHHITSGSAIKLRGSWDKFFQSSHWLEIGWASVCYWERVSDCLCITWGFFVCFGFLFLFFSSFIFFSSLVHPFFVSIHEFLLLFPSDSLHHPTGETESMTGYGFSCWPGSTHYSHVAPCQASP